MSAVRQYAQAIKKAQDDRDRKILAIIAKALGVADNLEAVQPMAHRIKKHRMSSAERFFVDDKPVAFATHPKCSQGVNDAGVVTVTASYELTDETVKS